MSQVQIISSWTSILGLMLSICVFLYQSKRAMASEIKLSNVTKALQEMNSETRGVSENLKQVSENISTKPLGMFPLFMGEIVEAVSAAKDKVCILCDFPRYGYFSSYDLSQQLRTKLNEFGRNDEIDIRFIVMKKEPAERVLRTQHEHFFEGDDLHDDERDQFFVRLDKYCRASGGSINSIEDFCSMVIVDQDRSQDDVSRRYHDGIPPLHCWIIDNRVAIFSIPGDVAWEEYAFRTEDPKLVESLARVHQAYWDRASKDSQ